jgi:hypothetical protein
MSTTLQPWNVARAEVTVPFLDAAPDVDDAATLSDNIRTRGGVFLLLSNRAKTLLESCRLAPEIGFVPTDVLNPSGRTLAKCFVVYHRRPFYKVLDLARSDVEMYSGGKVVAEVKHWVLDPSKIPDVDLFHAETSWIATERIWDIFEDNEITGCRFIPIESYDERCLAREKPQAKA